MSVLAPEARAPVLGRVVDVRAGEVRGLAWAFTYFFALLCGFYLLRPLREEMGIRGGIEHLQWVFTGTFAVMLAAVPAYSALVARVPRAQAVPWVYRFFLLNLLAFFALFRAGVAAAWVARAFFVWVSVYNLFVVAVFWSLMADLFSPAQGRRLFGFIAAGGSAGALVGPALAAALVPHVGVAGLVLLSAALLEVSARCAGRLVAWSRAASPAPSIPEGEGTAGVASPGRGGEALGGSLLAGITTVVRSPYLLGLAAQVLLTSLYATFLYFQQARLVAQAVPDPVRRTQLFAAVDLAVNVVSLATQSLATGRLVAALGLGPALALAPALAGVGFAALAAVPNVWTLGTLQSLRRAVHYGLERPSREVLFTVVSREEKYKAKAFIDTVVYRGGDALAGWAHTGLASVGLSAMALSLAAIPATAAGVVLAFWLARRERVLEEGAPPGLRQAQAERGRP